MSSSDIIGVTTFSLVLFAAILIYVIVRFSFCGSRAARIDYVRGFKKGQCALVFLAAIPLYCVGALYGAKTEINATSVITNIFVAVTEVIGLVVLKFDSEVIVGLADANTYYRCVLYVCYVFVVLNALMFTLSLLGQRLWEYRKRFCSFITRRDRLIIFGYNKSSVEIYKSAGADKNIKEKNKGGRADKPADRTAGETVATGRVKKNKISRMIVGDIGGDGVKLYADKIAHTKKDDGKMIDRILKSIGAAAPLFGRNKHITVVINTESDEKNIALCRAFAEKLKDAKPALRERCFDYLEVYVFGSAPYEAIYLDIVDNGYGCIRYKNRYEMMAIDFIDRYPLSLFMTEKQIDYGRALVKDGVNINVFLVGFGKFNRRALLTSVASNQFVCAGKSNKDPIPKLVNYYVYDKDEVHNKNLNHNYYRYMRERDGMNAKDYLPLPDSELIDAKDKKAKSYFPANEIVTEKLDINNGEFYKSILKRIKNGGAASNDANFVVIAFGTDLENIDLAQKLAEKRSEWGADFTIFVKVVNGEVSENTCGFNCGADGAKRPYFVIADEKRTVYDIHKIKSSKLYEMALARNDIYNFKNQPEKQALETSKTARKKWYEAKTQIERDSNLYAVLHIRSKLNMFGYDYCDEKSERAGVFENRDGYEKVYAKDDGIYRAAKSRAGDGDRDKETVSQKGISDKAAATDGKSAYEVWIEERADIKYPFDTNESGDSEFPREYKTGTLRRSLAVLEHQRWNAYMISKGMVPAPIKKIKEEKGKIAKVGGDGKLYYKEDYTDGKNYKMRRHGNISTFSALDEFRKIVVGCGHKKESDADVVRYDYQIMDELYDFLKAHGYKIVKKSTPVR